MNKTKLTFWEKFWLLLLRSNCKHCNKGRLSRDLIRYGRYGKIVECNNCRTKYKVDWF